MRARAAVQQAFQYGLVFLTLAVLLGLANATQLFGALDRNTLFAYHFATLAWITMGVIGIAIWVFARRNDDLGAPIVLSAVTTAAYVMAFWSGDFILRAVFGLAELAVIFYWWWFAYTAASREGGIRKLDIPKMSVLLGLTTLVIGSLSILVQVLLASGELLPTSTDLIGGYGSAQTGGYLALVAAGFAEWQLIGGSRRTTLALVQVYLLFAGGLLLSASPLLAAVLGQPLAQGLLGLATLLTLAGVVIAALRIGPAALATPWMAPTGMRHIAVAVPFLVAAVILQAILAQQVMASQGDISLVPSRLLYALDLTYFVGVLTNLIFGAILVTSSDRGTTLSKTPARPRVWPWADDVIFWGLNVGVAALIALLLIAGSGEDSAAFTHPVAFVAPIMGLAALLGIATYLMRMMGAPAALSRRARA